MPFIHRHLFPVMWLSYLGYWSVMATNVKATERLKPAWSRITRLAVIAAAILLLSLPHVPVPLLGRRFLPLTASCFWTGALVTAAGLLLSIWARHHLGSNWSQAVTVKKEHELIT